MRIKLLVVVSAVLVTASCGGSGSGGAKNDSSQKVNEQQSGMPMLAANTCPDRFESRNGQAVAVLHGTDYGVTGEGASYINDHCPDTEKGGPGGGSNANEPQTLSQIFSAGQCSGGGDVAFTSPFANPQEISYVSPMGDMLGAHITPIDHLYVYYPETSSRSAGDGKYPVVAPADGHVVVVEKLDSDYRVVIEHNCDMYSVFIHVQKLAGAVASAVGSPASNHPWSGRVAIKAGETFAFDGGAPGYDYSLFDQRVTLKFANVASYARAEGWKIHTVDPFDYLREPGKSALLAKDLRQVAPRGGKIDYDQKGTAAGNWFVVGSNGYAGLPQNQMQGPITPNQQHGYWDTHLALAPNPIDPSAVEVSIGGYNGGQVAQFAVVGNAPRPEDITESSGIVAYELVPFGYVTAGGASWIANGDRNPPYDSTIRVQPKSAVAGVLLVRVNHDGTLTVEAFPGKTKAQVRDFDGSAKQYTH